MPQGDKNKYTEKQKREARHLKEGYEKRGFSVKETAIRAWTMINKMYGGGTKVDFCKKSCKNMKKHES